MDDTSENFKSLYHQKIMERSGEERVIMGDSMFNSARELALASLSNTVAADEKRFLLFLRFYGNDFSTEQQAQIKKILLVRSG
ncbi:MAG: hypothetical protein WCQ99_17300 [Pseudomonadota bacterium]